MKKKSTVWWGTFKLDENQIRFWEVGSLLLGIERLTHEWRIASDSKNDPELSDIKVNVEECPEFSKDNLHFSRFVFNKTKPTITLTPTVADRPQVSHAEKPFYIPPNEHITIYVSSPAWVRIETNDPSTLLGDVPTVRQSDTWYGPNTREGELCYASRTFCRTNFEEIPIRPNRVISPVIIYNHENAPLLIDHLSLPLPFLSVYVDENGNLWTEEIVIKNELHHKHVIKQGKGAPHIAPTSKLISPPRMPLKPHNLITMFYSLLTE